MADAVAVVDVGCIVIRSGERCGKLPTRTIIWSDGDKSPACEDCALYVEQLAQSNGTRIKVEKSDG